jgi:hypothetical protein
MTDLGTGIGRDMGIAVNGMGIAGTVDTIGQGNFELLTGVRMAGRCKTVSANHTEATNVDPEVAVHHTDVSSPGFDENRLR